MTEEKWFEWWISEILYRVNEVVEIVMNYNDYFWGDSILEKIEVVYDKIVITVYNDVLQKNIIVECSQCAGMTQLINWDENIIENIFLKEIPRKQHPIITKIKELYGVNSYDSEKSIEGRFFELRILLINEVSFSVICKNVSFMD